MARLSAELIRRSPRLLNATKERVLDLRGNNIALIENLEAAGVSSAVPFPIQMGSADVTKSVGWDQIDTIDLSDNEIVKLEGFPYMSHFGTLLINNNRIAQINANLGEFLPMMHTLALMNNRLATLSEIDHLASLPKLQSLNLLDNTVTKQPDYRLYVIHKLKHLRLLDLKNVEQQESSAAAQKFHSKEAEEETKKVAAKVDAPVNTQDITKEQGPKLVAPAPAQIMAIKEIIGADSDPVLGTQHHQIELYIHKNFQQTLYNVMSSRRKRPYRGIHIIPLPRMQEQGIWIITFCSPVQMPHAQFPDLAGQIFADSSRDCAYHATIGTMESDFKALYARRPKGQLREFNVKLSHQHLKLMVQHFYASKEGENFKPRHKLPMRLLMAKRYGVISEADWEAGLLHEAVRYKIDDYCELSDRQMRAIPDLLDEGKSVLTSFRVTERYKRSLPHDIYRYVPEEDTSTQERRSDDGVVTHESHCVVLISHGLSYKTECEAHSLEELRTGETYYEYLNSYSAGFGVDGCGYVYADSIRKSYLIRVKNV
ncbi:hypothetical protein ACQ4PT_000743 [Festuca glaucescens]